MPPRNLNSRRCPCPLCIETLRTFACPSLHEISALSCKSASCTRITARQNCRLPQTSRHSKLRSSLAITRGTAVIQVRQFLTHLAVQSVGQTGIVAGIVPSDWQGLILCIEPVGFRTKSSKAPARVC